MAGKIAQENMVIAYDNSKHSIKLGWAAWIHAFIAMGANEGNLICIACCREQIGEKTDCHLMLPGVAVKIWRQIE